MIEERPVKQEIFAIRVPAKPGWRDAYEVGQNDVTRIEACEKHGPYTPIPYVRVWVGETCLAEFCQHQIVGVYFYATAQSLTPTSSEQDT